MSETKEKKENKSVCTLDVSEVRSEEELHGKIREALELSETTEVNWQALVEVMSTRVKMPKRLNVRGLRTLRVHCPKAARRFVRVMREYERAPGSPECMVRDLDAPAAFVFWLPDILLLTALPVEVMVILVMFSKGGWKMAAAALTIAVLAAVATFTVVSFLSSGQDRWWVGPVHKKCVNFRAVAVLLLGVVVAIGFYKVLATQSIGVPDALALAAGVISFASTLLEAAVFVVKTR